MKGLILPALSIAALLVPLGAPYAEEVSGDSDQSETSPHFSRIAYLDLRNWDWTRFHENYKNQVVALSSSHGAERSTVLLDFAELFLSQMMLYEANSVLQGIEPGNDMQRQRHQALKQAAGLLDGSALETDENSPLLETNRPDQAFWKSLHAIATNDSVSLDESLAEGFVGMTFQPKPVLRVILPLFTEAAIALRKEALAADALQLIGYLPELSTSPVGSFLRGRAAELKGNEKTALDEYFAASAGWDRYAARARLALADMALRNSGHGALLAARDVLAQGEDSWRGDNYELEILEKLAAIFVKLGDAQGGLLTYAKIMVRFPTGDASLEARDKATKLLDTVYERGATGELSLGKWVSIHLTILPLLRNNPRFSLYVEKLADRALELGASSLAAAEYRRALVLVEQNETVSSTQLAAASKNRIRLKMARAQQQLGRLAEARQTLELIEFSDDSPFREEVFALKAKILAETGENDRFLGVYVANPDEHQLRNMARAFLEKRAWGEAIEFYEQLKAEFPQKFSAEDATYLLIAANRSDDIEREQKVISEFPGLTASHEWIDLTKGFLVAPAPITPLRRETARDRLDNLDQVIKKIENSGF